ncbi:type 1 fimbrial protein [Klebsiella sp. T2.Ur]|nr:type 1 fimbrial protein [Klebsiella sp. T2.Ur]
MNILRFGCLCTLGLSFFLSAKENSSTLGEVNVTGEIVEAACYVDPDDSNKFIEFGDISARAFNSKGNESLEKVFSIHLDGCQLVSIIHPDEDYHDVDFTFSGEMTDGDPGVIKTHGTAKHIGIRLYDRQGNALTLGRPTRHYSLISGDNTLTFRAEVVRTGSGMVNGEFNSVVHFVVGYF